LTNIYLVNGFLFSAISPITDDNATFFCFFSFGRLLVSKTKKRSPEAMKNHFGTFVFRVYGA